MTLKIALSLGSLSLFSPLAHAAATSEAVLHFAAPSLKIGALKVEPDFGAKMAVGIKVGLAL